MDSTGNRDSHEMRIDKRILKHLLHETADLLEESQTHALVEKPTATTAHLLAQATWRMTATCAWALSELTPSVGETGQAARLHAPSPIFSREDGEVSRQLESFISRVNRLHERARKLDELSRGPTVSSAEPATADATVEPVAAEPRQSAPIIPLYGNGADAAEGGNAVRQAHNRLNLLLSVRD